LTAQLYSPRRCAFPEPARTSSPHRSWPCDVVFLAHGQSAAMIRFAVASSLQWVIRSIVHGFELALTPCWFSAPWF
jgi:hypothetical protein